MIKLTRLSRLKEKVTRVATIADPDERWILIDSLFDQFAEPDLKEKEIELYHETLTSAITSFSGLESHYEAILFQIKKYELLIGASGREQSAELYHQIIKKCIELRKVTEAKQLFSSVLKQLKVNNTLYQKTIQLFYSSGINSTEDLLLFLDAVGHISFEAETELIEFIERACKIDEQTPQEKLELLLSWNLEAGKKLRTVFWHLRNQAIGLLFGGDPDQTQIATKLIIQYLEHYPADSLASRAIIILAIRSHDKQSIQQRFTLYSPALGGELPRYRRLVEYLPGILNDEAIPAGVIIDPEQIAEDIEDTIVKRLLGATYTLIKARIYRLKGEFHQALPLFKANCKSSNPNPVIYYETIRCFIETDNAKEAAVWIAQALELFESVPVELACLNFELNAEVLLHEKHSQGKNSLQLLKLEDETVTWLYQTKIFLLQKQFSYIEASPQIDEYIRRSFAEEYIRIVYLKALTGNNAAEWQHIRIKPEFFLLPVSERLFADTLARYVFNPSSDIQSNIQTFSEVYKRFPYLIQAKRLSTLLLLSQQNSIPEAPDTVNDTHDSDRSIALVYLNALVAFRQRQSDAIDRWNEIVRLRPKEPVPHLYLALIQQNRYENELKKAEKTPESEALLAELRKTVTNSFHKALMVATPGSSALQMIIYFYLDFIKSEFKLNPRLHITKNITQVFEGIMSGTNDPKMEIIKALVNLETHGKKKKAAQSLMKLISSKDKSVLPYIPILAPVLASALIRDIIKKEQWTEVTTQLDPGILGPILIQMRLIRFNQFIGKLQASENISRDLHAELASVSATREADDECARILVAYNAVLHHDWGTLEEQLANITISSPSILLMRAVIFFRKGEFQRYRSILESLITVAGDIRDRSRALHALLVCINEPNSLTGKRLIALMIEKNPYIRPGIAIPLMHWLLVNVTIPSNLSQNIEELVRAHPTYSLRYYLYKLKHGDMTQAEVDQLLETVCNQSPENEVKQLLEFSCHRAALHFLTDRQTALKHIQHALKLLSATGLEAAEPIWKSQLNLQISSVHRELQIQLIYNSLATYLAGAQPDEFSTPLAAEFRQLAEYALATPCGEQIAVAKSSDLFDQVWQLCADCLQDNPEAFRLLALLYRKFAINAEIAHDVERARRNWIEATAYWFLYSSTDTFANAMASVCGETTAVAFDSDLHCIRVSAKVWCDYHKNAALYYSRIGDEELARLHLRILLFLSTMDVHNLKRSTSIPDELFGGYLAYKLKCIVAIAKAVIDELQQEWGELVSQSVSAITFTHSIHEDRLRFHSGLAQLKFFLVIWENNLTFTLKLIELANSYRSELYQLNKVTEIQDVNEKVYDLIKTDDNLLCNAVDNGCSLTASQHVMWRQFSESAVYQKLGILNTAIHLQPENCLARLFVAKNLQEITEPLESMLEKLIHLNYFEIGFIVVQHISEQYQYQITEQNKEWFSTQLGKRIQQLIDRGQWRTALIYCEGAHYVQEWTKEIWEQISYVRERARDELYYQRLTTAQKELDSGRRDSVHELIKEIPEYFSGYELVKHLVAEMQA